MTHRTTSTLMLAVGMTLTLALGGLLLWQFDALSRGALAGLAAGLGVVATAAVSTVVFGRVDRRLARVELEADGLRRERATLSRQVVQTGKLASVGELAAGIAHEINNPMAVMIEEAGWIQDLLAEGFDKPENLEELRRAAEQIQTQGRRCKDITHKLLSFARKPDAPDQPVQLNDRVAEAVDLLAQKARHANVTVELELQPDLPELVASVTELQQLLVNLLHNAVDAMEGTGGTITVTSAEQAGAVRVSVRDTGPGIAKEHLGRIFEPLFTTKPAGKGTGLGLSICHRIVADMGGRIEVESQPGEGTVFHVLLPPDDGRRQGA